jgi:hypothetical protein
VYFLSDERSVLVSVVALLAWLPALWIAVRSGSLAASLLVLVVGAVVASALLAEENQG